MRENVYIYFRKTSYYFIIIYYSCLNNNNNIEMWIEINQVL